MRYDEYGQPLPLTLAEVRAKHPLWAIERVHGGGLLCRYGAWRFRAVDPGDADAGIRVRETPMTDEQMEARRR